MTESSATHNETATHSLSEAGDFVWAHDADNAASAGAASPDAADTYSSPAAAHDSPAAVDADQAGDRDLADDDLGDLSGDDVRLSNDSDLDTVQPGPVDYTTPSAGAARQPRSSDG